MQPRPASIPTRDEAMKRGGPCSALRLVDPGEDPRILSTNPDHFFGKAWANGSTSGLLALIIMSVLGVRFITMEAWDTGGDLPWFWNLVWLVMPWAVLAPFWGAWLRHQPYSARVRDGRKAITAMSNGVQKGPPIGVEEGPPFRI